MRGSFADQGASKAQPPARDACDLKRREIRDNAVTLHCFGPIDDGKSTLGVSKRLSLSIEPVGLTVGS